MNILKTICQILIATTILLVSCEAKIINDDEACSTCKIDETLNTDTCECESNEEICNTTCEQGYIINSECECEIQENNCNKTCESGFTVNENCECEAKSTSALNDSYAKIAYATYNDTYISALEMQTKINEFLVDPSLEKLATAKYAWQYAHYYYCLSEAFRGANGPIDNETLLNTEERINSWILNEAYIDYVYSNESFTTTVQEGLIGQDFEITEENVLSKNKEGGELNIATGWHVIEFLLWGEDINNSDNKIDYYVTGNRPPSDYSNKENFIRRIQLIQIVTHILVSDLKNLKETWAEGGEYRKTFEGLSEKETFTNILSGLSYVSNTVIASERLDTAIDGGHENEYSKFSDDTIQNISANVYGLYNVLIGKYTQIDGTVISGVSIIDFIAETDKTASQNLETVINDVILKLYNFSSTNQNFEQITSQETLESNGIAGQLSQTLKEQASSITTALTLLDSDQDTE